MIDLLGNLIEKIKAFGLENIFNRYYSSYRAQVVDNLDPEKRGRIKVKIPVLFGDDPLPNWFLPKGFYGAGKDKGTFCPPEIEDWLFVGFEMGSLTSGFYELSGWHSEGELSSEFTFEGDDPQVIGYIRSDGSRILFDKTKDKNKLSLIAKNGADKEHQLVMSLEKGKEKLELKSVGHTLTLDDTDGKEIISLLSKIGTKIEINEKGNFSLLTKLGHTLLLDDANKLVKISTKEGANITLKDNIVISESKSKTTITIAADGIKVVTDKDLTMQSKNTTIKSDKIAFDGGGGKMSLTSNKVAIGTSSAELVDSLVTILDELMNDPVFALTPNGPGLGISPTLKAKLTIIKSKLSGIKGSL